MGRDSKKNKNTQPSSTPIQHPHPTYGDARGSPHVARPSPAPAISSDFGDMDPAQIPANQKKEGPDWFVLYNPRVPRTLDVDLVHTLEHNSVVCCVRFSADGKYVATGCNRSAQIFDVKTGAKVQHLQDDTVEREGDLYIRSVCFSPDGRYLATGAEDKLIRASYSYLASLTATNMTSFRYGILQAEQSSTPLLVMSRISTLLILLVMVDTLPPEVEIGQSEYGISKLHGMSLHSV